LEETNQPDYSQTAQDIENNKRMPEKGEDGEYEETREKDSR